LAPPHQLSVDYLDGPAARLPRLQPVEVVLVLLAPLRLIALGLLELLLGSTALGVRLSDGVLAGGG
jgi:hypothetical protein